MHNHHQPFLKGFRIVGVTILGAIAIVVFGLIFGIFVQLLWNWLMPHIFRLPEITYWEAFGIIILGKLILGNFGPRPGHHRNHHYGPFPLRHHLGHGHHSPWRDEWNDEEWQLKGGCKNWKHYDDWWHSEGKAAFEGYIDRVTTSPDEEKK